jgi:hypothetical protein
MQISPRIEWVIYAVLLFLGLTILVLAAISPFFFLDANPVYGGF